MNHLFRVKTLQSRTLDKEVYLTMRFNSRTKIIKAVLIALCVIVYVVICTYLTATKEWKFYSSLERVLVVLMWSAVLYLIYNLAFQVRKYVRSSEKVRWKAVGDKSVYTEILFFDSYLSFRSAISSATYTYMYTDIIELYESKHYYHIVTRTGASPVGVLPFDKNGFVDGTCEKAVQLLREKGNISSTGDGLREPS